MLNIPTAYSVDTPWSHPIETCTYPQNTVKDESRLREYLCQSDWPVNLQTFFIQEINKVPVRYFIYDDSGSMSTNDREKMIDNNTIECSRWSELCETMNFQVQASRIGKIKSHFIFLNGQSYKTDQITNLDQTLMNNMTGGDTPLFRTLNKIISEIRLIEQELRCMDQKVSITISTGGKSSDGCASSLLSTLKKMPVDITLRLCTNEERIIRLWNYIDRALDLSLNIIDGYCSEATKVYSVNSSLCYTLPIHQLREYGISCPLFDHLGKMTLTDEDQGKMSNIICGDGLLQEPLPFCPILKTNRPYINIGFTDTVNSINTNTQVNQRNQRNHRKKDNNCVIS